MSLNVASPLPHVSEKSYKTAWDRVISIHTPCEPLHSDLQMAETPSN